jgi:hypothetical protein
MNNIGRMNGLESTKGLVDEILGMIIGQVLGPDNAVHVCFHQFLDHWRMLQRSVTNDQTRIEGNEDKRTVNFFERIQRSGLDHVNDRNDLEHRVALGSRVKGQ